MKQQGKTPVLVWFAACGLSAAVFGGVGFGVNLLLHPTQPAHLAAKALPHGEAHDAPHGEAANERKEDHHAKASHAEHKDTPAAEANHASKHENTKHEKAEHGAKHEDDKHEPAHTNKKEWSYEGEGGPKHWANLQSDYAICGDGKYQSPINIEKPRHADISAAIEFSYHESIVSIVNNGRMIEANFPEGNTIKVQGRSYKLVKAHFHAPSEHLINNASYPIELQLEHKDDGGNIAVVAVFVEGGKHNKAFDGITKNMPTHKDQTITDVRLNPNALIPAIQSYLRYDGSLTYPPCSENVAWHIMTTPVSISADQIETLGSAVGVNARPVQPAYMRNAVLHETGLTN